MNASSWELLSSDGRESARWIVLERDALAPEPAFLCDVILAGHYFSAPLAAGSGSEASRDFTLELRRLAVPTRTLDRLVTALQAWLDQPARELDASRLALDCELGGLFDQRLRLVLGERADTLSSGHPVATLSYTVGRLRGELSFVTDPACLAAFCEAIGDAIRSDRESV